MMYMQQKDMTVQSATPFSSTRGSASGQGSPGPAGSFVCVGARPHARFRAAGAKSKGKQERRYARWSLCMRSAHLR